MPIIHGQTDIQDLVERYLRGELSHEEEQEWEEHYFRCSECFRLLDDTAKIARFVKNEAPNRPEWYEDANRHMSVIRSLPQIVKTAPRWQSFLAAAVVLVVIGIPVLTGWLKIRDLESEIHYLRSPAIPGRNFVLQQGVRGNRSDVILSIDAGAFLLQFNIPTTIPEDVTYKAWITNSASETIWSTDNLIGYGLYGTFLISCHASFFEDGAYALHVEPHPIPTESTVNSYSFPFRIVKETPDR